MERNSTRMALLDLSSVLAVILPIAQLAFVYLPESLKDIYLKQEVFLGVSLVTLILSYICLLAYKARPYSTFVSPFRKKKMQEYNNWQQQIYQANAALNLVKGKKDAKEKVEKFLKTLEKKDIRKPFEINAENRMATLLSLLFINVVMFLVLGLGEAKGFWQIIQSLNYVFSIVIAVLVLVIYRDASQGTKRYEENLRHSSSRAIDLAIKHNCFSVQPQIMFISAHGGGGLSDYFVRVRYNNDEYEISTNSDATKLIYCYKLTAQVTASSTPSP